MGLKPMLFPLASFLLFTTRVSSNNEEFLTEAPTHSPVKAPPPPAQVPVPPPPLAKVPVRAPPPIPIDPWPMVPPPPKARIPCLPLCVQRCKLHSRKKMCLRACTTCCSRCKCAPPGTYGNREKCGKCYTSMTTRGGRPKYP